MIITQPSVFDAYEVTPSDTTDLPGGPTKEIYLGDSSAVDVNVVMQGGQTVKFENLQPGVIHYLAVKRALSTDTTATKIIALY